MKMLIVEDEAATIRFIQRSLHEFFPEVEVVQILSSVKECLQWIPEHLPDFEIALMDIRLSDGLSLDIFQKINITQPVIFLTAYDNFALRAFQTSGISYLLKPLDIDQLKKALEKYRVLQKSGPDNSLSQISELIRNLAQAKVYRKAFLVHQKDRMIPLKAEDIAYIWSEQEICRAKTLQGQIYILDSNLEKLESELDPNFFYRANRQYLIHHRSVKEVHFYFNGRLSLDLQPAAQERILISKAKSTDFKNWMNR